MRRKGMSTQLFAMLLSAMVLVPYASPHLVLAQEINQTDTRGNPQEEEGEERTQVTSGEYFDEQGVSYKWYGFSDGKSEIYEMRLPEENAIVDIPEEIEGYTVTELTGNLRWKKISSLTIPKTIERFGLSTFEHASIKTLHFNAANARNREDFFFCPFAYANVGEVIFGEEVESIGDYTFYQTIFEQEEFVLRVPNIGKYAFHSASFQALTVTDDIKTIFEMAFEQAKIQSLHYECPNVSYLYVDDLLSGPFVNATIWNLDFSDDIKRVPDYCFAEAHFKMKDYTIDIEEIGNYAFFGTWDSSGLWVGTDMVDKLIISNQVKFIGKEAFGSMYINELVFDANVESNADSNLNGPFYVTDIHKLTITENVKKIPDRFFANADFAFEELMVETPEVGSYAFYNTWCGYDSVSPKGKLTVTSQVEKLGRNAFGDCELAELHFNCNATTDAYDALTGVFYDAKVDKLFIGDEVTMIQPYLFANTDFKVPQDLVLDIPIGNYGFYAATSLSGGFSNVTLGENVSFIGKNAFRYRSMDSLNYQAVAANTEGTKTGDAPFIFAKIKNLLIGEQVIFLDKAIFCGLRTNMDELVIPDSVESIGSYAFYNTSLIDSDYTIDNLKIGIGLKYLSYTAFAERTFHNISVEALEGNENYGVNVPGDSVRYLPQSENLSIHHNSAFYPYFSRKAAQIDLYCDEYMVLQDGEEFFDEEKLQYVTPHYEVCSVCGYQVETDSYEAAFSVIFVADDEILATKYCKKDGTVEAPEIPAKDGFTIEGWDVDFSSVTENLIVHAKYKEIEVTPPEEEPTPTPEPEPEPIPPVIDPEPTPEPEPKPPIIEPEPEPEPTPPIVEPEPEPTPPIVEPEPEPTPPIIEPEPEPEPTPEPTPPIIEPEPEPEPKPPIIEPEPEPEPKPPVIEPEPTPEPEPKPPVIEPEPTPEPKPPVIEEEPSPTPEPKPPVIEEEPSPTPEPKPPVIELEPEPEPKPPVVKPEPTPEPKPPVVKPEPTSEPKPPVVKLEPTLEPKPPVIKPEPKPPVIEEEPRPIPPEPTPPIVEDNDTPSPKPPVIEEKPTPKPEVKPTVVEDKESPKTEDESELPIIMSLLVALSGSGGAVFLFLLRRRKVKGSVVDADGKPLAEVRVTLDDKETLTNERGEFCFKGARRGNHDLCVYHPTDSIALSMSICTEESVDSDIFTVIKDGCLRVDSHKEGKFYLVDVMVQ